MEQKKSPKTDRDYRTDYSLKIYPEVKKKVNKILSV